VDRIVGLSLAYEVEDGAEKVYYIPIAHQTADFVQLELQAVLLLFRPVLQDAQVNKIFQNAKFDLHFLRAVDADVPAEQVFDTMIAARLLRPEWQRVDLATLAQDYLKITIAEYKDLFADYSDFSAVPLAKAAPYAASDALCTLRLKKILAPQLQEQQLATLFTQVESPLIKVILAMEEAGICLDLAVLNRLAQEIAHEQKILEQKIRASFENLGVANAAAVNLLSPKQVEQVLFDELKLEPILKHKGGARSTGKEVLEELAKKHYLPGMILEYRRLAKLKNTYIDALPKQINPQTGRVHTTFTQARVATGRLSSLDPNLQNVPPQIREAFVPANGWQFLSADYSQIELRVLAHLSQDPALLESFRTGQDVHLQTAAQIFACSVDAVTMEQRQIGKKINFSVIYGLSAFNLARELNLSRSTAQNYIDAFFVQYQGVVQWMRTTVEQVKKVGYSTTLMGRKRFFPEINDRNALVSQAAQRAAINSVVQGTASEILKIAMVRLAAEMERLQLEAKILLQVHDELLFEVLPNELELLKSLVQKLMAQAVELQVPLEVSVKTGNNWGFVAKKH
jgi:DNA polymerase-1